MFSIFLPTFVAMVLKPAILRDSVAAASPLQLSKMTTKREIACFGQGPIGSYQALTRLVPSIGCTIPGVPAPEPEKNRWRSRLRPIQAHDQVDGVVGCGQPVGFLRLAGRVLVDIQHQ